MGWGIKSMNQEGNQLKKLILICDLVLEINGKEIEKIRKRI